ncbi:hypothetical protein HUU59_03155 [bacterium]|nr:hypothetical protein [bacterium]
MKNGGFPGLGSTDEADIHGGWWLGWGIKIRLKHNLGIFRWKFHQPGVVAGPKALRRGLKLPVGFLFLTSVEGGRTHPHSTDFFSPFGQVSYAMVRSLIQRGGFKAVILGWCSDSEREGVYNLVFPVSSRGSTQCFYCAGE